MKIELDTEACFAGWGPEAHGPFGWRVGHYCGRTAGHRGRHVCEMCRSWLAVALLLARSRDGA